MSKSMYVTRDRFSWKWKENPGFGWTPFNDNAKDNKSMQQYLSAQGDPVNLLFVDENHRQASIFEVRRKEGAIEAVLNAGEKILPLYDWNFIPNTETLQYFHDRTTPDVIQKADTIPGEMERVKFYKDNADELTREKYKALLSERTSDSAISNYLQDYEPYKTSIVHFTE